MRVFAYCAESFAESTRKAAGVEPITCPPLLSMTIDVEQFNGQDFIYLDLHGAPNDAQWYGDNGIMALTAEQVQQMKLNSAIVFACNCYLADANSPMLDALLDAGASYVIAGDGKNYGGERNLFGAAKLGSWFRRFVSMRIDPLRALSMAKKMIALELINPQTRAAAKDTLNFKAYYRKATP